GKGGAIGILAALGDFPYPVSGESVESCELLLWHEKDITRLMTRVPQLAINGMKMLARRFADMMDRYRELATERVERRIARALLRLTKQSGRKTKHGILIDLPLTRRDLAEMTGTTLYTVSRILSGWEQKGYVKTGRGQVTICSPHAMAKIAEDLPEGKINL
ncbi:MAG: Crp/Fnr family transcriptional regulator, partial [Anaerolineae bacterium]